MSNNIFSEMGNDGCPCIDASVALSSIVADRLCELPNGQDGLQTTLDGPCVPPTYGSGGCLRHEMLHDPKCDTPAAPDFCFRPWCFVDAEVCGMSSKERVFRSDYFPHDSGVDLFFSYSTCGSSGDDWLNYKESLREPLVGNISAIIPSYSFPMMYKRDSDGEILTAMGDEYYNSSVPYEGVFMTYLQNLMDLANGNFTIDYTHASNAGKIVHPNSIYTGAMQDVGDGLADMVVGQTWITGQRLTINSFTLPLYYDKMVLAIPKPSEDTSLSAQTQKVLKPFTLEVWILIVAIIAITALVSVWFSWFGKTLRQRKNPKKRMKTAYFRLAIDEILKKGMFFCSAGVEQEEDGTLPQRLLMFGFALFILIVVSAYVANLAAFLTRPVTFTGTIESAREKGLKVCAHPALSTELQVAWPTVQFVYNDNDYFGMLAAYSREDCDVLAVSVSDVTSDVALVTAFCNSGLVLTESLVTETPVAFSIRPDLAPGLSYWIHQGEKNHGITLEAAQKEYNDLHQYEPFCNLKLSTEDESSDYAQIHPENLFFPFMFFAGFAGLAIILQIWHQRNMKKREKSPAVGRGHSLSLFGRQATMSRQFFEAYTPNRHTHDKDDEMSEEDQPPIMSSAMQPGGFNDEEDTQSVENKAVGFSDTTLVEKKGVRFTYEEDVEEKGVRFSDTCCSSDSFHENETIATSLMTGTFADDASAASLSEGYDATSRLQQLIAQTSTFDDILECLQDIKRQERK